MLYVLILAKSITNYRMMIKILNFLCSLVMICSTMEKYELVIFSNFGMLKNYLFYLINGPYMIFIG
jgi:hypothetical protein